MPLPAVADAHIRGQDPAEPGSPRQVALWRYGALAVATEVRGSKVEVAAVLDDRDEFLDAAHADAWREWLRLSNALMLRDWPTVVTTTSRVGSALAAGVAGPAAGGSVVEATFDHWAPEWVEAHRLAVSPLEIELVIALATRGSLPPPAFGFEGPAGIPIDMSWPHLRIAVDLPGMRDDDRAEILAAGWRFIEPVPDTIEAAVVGAARSNPGSDA